jgi:ribulose-5-phosphate 4-epimerase/fuculose-1-phosphate aldolase
MAWIAPDEAQAREAIVAHGRSLFELGLTAGISGNISVRPTNGWLITPTNSCLGRLVPERNTRLHAEGCHVSGDPASKEAVLHRALYTERPGAGASVHLHATHSAEVSYMAGLDAHSCIPPLNAQQMNALQRAFPSINLLAAP